ncbi:Spc97/Spc98 [Lasiodiplodia theobromae]|nr:Spc97/Spc98 [Lasiodiplodia theobromae]
MLHEILLSLSGHPSSLFDAEKQDSGAQITPASFPLLSPPEAELLSSVARLSQLHRELRNHAQTIASSHPSTVCRAVATAITSSHLAKFQQKILDVEARILKQDASIVGAYNIVPLAGVVAEFDEWTRRMEWYWDMACFMLPKEDGDAGACTGAGLIDRLRQEAQTGYPDVEAAALDLSKVAETAWLRQLSTWVLYGRLPTHGTNDFFITRVKGDDEPVDYVSTSTLLPKFVSSRTASSILFIGRSLDQIRNRGAAGISSIAPKTSELELLPVHLRYLSSLQVPISTASLSEAISAIRLSLSRNTLQQLLPLPKILQILSLLQEFFLLGRGEFAVALIEESDERIRSRHRRPGQSKPSRGVQTMLVKEGEVTAVLSRSWARLAALINDEEMSDENLDLARSLVHLSMSNPTSTRPSTPGRAKEGVDALPKLSNVVFNDLLLSIPTSLKLDVSSPLDLFLTSSEVDCYSTIHAYLLAVRRAHLRLTDLWRQSSIRREHPTPFGPPVSNSPWGASELRKRRQRANARTVSMRKVWATSGAAVFLLSEFVGYFEGEVVQESWKHFRHWIVGAESDNERPSSPTDADNEDPAELSRPPTQQSLRQNQQISRPATVASTREPRRTPHDPEVLASAHRLFLRSLSYALLLTDLPYTHALRSFLTHVDELIAFIDRLRTVQRNLDLERDEGVVDALANYEQEEKDVLLELDRARKRVDSDLRSLVARLRELDKERVGTGLFGDGESIGGFEPWRGGGVDRLLMKLDFGASANEEADDDDEGFDLV